MTEQRDWPLEQSAKGALRPWHYTAVGYLAVLFEDFEEAERAQRGLRERGVSEGDLRLYDDEETGSQSSDRRGPVPATAAQYVTFRRSSTAWTPGSAQAASGAALCS